MQAWLLGGGDGDRALLPGEDLAPRAVGGVEAPWTIAVEGEGGRAGAGVGGVDERPGGDGVAPRVAVDGPASQHAGAGHAPAHLVRAAGGGPGECDVPGLAGEARPARRGGEGEAGGE